MCELRHASAFKLVYKETVMSEATTATQYPEQSQVWLSCYKNRAFVSNQGKPFKFKDVSVNIDGVETLVEDVTLGQLAKAVSAGDVNVSLSPEIAGKLGTSRVLNIGNTRSKA